MTLLLRKLLTNSQNDVTICNEYTNSVSTSTHTQLTKSHFFRV